MGGLWQNVVEEGGQGLGSVFKYTADLTAVQTGLQAEVAAGQFTGDTLTHVNTILADITTALSAATASVNGGGDFGSVAAAETALRTSHLDILDIVNNDANLAALATQDGANGFLAAPVGLADGVTAATAPHANLAEIGVIFNDVASQILGGVNADNAAVISNDVNAMITDMQALMTANPLLFGGLTGVHAEAVVRQLELENTYIAQAGINPDAGRGSNDNLLDIIDIVQGDTNLANMANQGGVSGFTPFGDALNPTPKYLDNDAQTNFWANFIAQSNSLGQAGDRGRHRARCGGDRCRDRRPAHLPDRRHQLRRRAGRHLRGAVRQRAARRHQHARSRGDQDDRGLADRKCGAGRRGRRADARQLRRCRRQQHPGQRRHL